MQGITSPESQDLLQKLGLSEPEVNIYLTVLQLGKGLPKHIAEKAGVKRPTLYALLPGLLETGLISETIIGKRRYLVAQDPEVYLSKKRAEIDQVEKLLPELRLLLSTASIKPRILVYDGIEGLRKIYMDNLKYGQEILEFVSLENIHPEIEFHSANYYIPRRISKGIPIKIIVSGTPRSHDINLLNNTKALREVKVIDSKQFPIPLDCYIYGENVSFALYRTDSEPVGVIIRSKEIAQMLRSLFLFIWEGNL